MLQLATALLVLILCVYYFSHPVSVNHPVFVNSAVAISNVPSLCQFAELLTLPICLLSVDVHLVDCYRTESVVEKLLTNWLSLCMYPYLKTHVNKSLFMLYKAIKHQTEKGPVDAVTAEARYSLSEDRLLREKTESRTLVGTLLLSSLILRRISLFVFFVSV